MKIKLFIIVLLFLGIKTFGRSGANNTYTIDPGDSVVFDISQAVFINNYVEIPVSIISNDAINALDFSFKYNQSNLQFDSIINHTSYVQPFSYYNSTDSTVRFTSYSFQSYSNDTTLISIRFLMVSGNITAADLYALNTFLNGDHCSVKIINPIITTGIAYNQLDKFVRIFPNPVSEVLRIEVPEHAIAQLYDKWGALVLLQTDLNANEEKQFNIRGIANGLYFLKIVSDHFTITKRVLINK